MLYSWSWIRAGRGTQNRTAPAWGEGRPVLLGQSVSGNDASDHKSGTERQAPWKWSCNCTLAFVSRQQ